MDQLGPYSSLAASFYVPSADDADPPSFVNLDPKYKCPICGRLLREPMQTVCGHRFCRSCVEVALTEAGDNGFPCPAKEEDCEVIRRDEINPDFSVLREINLLEVYCPYRQNGCTEIMQLRKFKTHQLGCRYKLTDCPYNVDGCRQVVTSESLPEHERRCEYRPESCPHCHQTMPQIHLSNHLQSECPQMMLDCPYKCGETNILRLNIAEHLKQCPSLCRFHSMGCAMQGSPEDLRIHEMNNAAEHLDLVMVHLATISLNNTRLQNALERLNDELDKLKTRLGEQNRANEALQQRLSHLVDGVKQSEQSHLKTLAGQNEKLLQMEDKCNEIELQQRELMILKVRQAQIDENIRILQNTGGASAATTTALPTGLQTQFIQHDRTLGMHDVRLAEMDLRLQCIETTNYDGCMVWKIGEYTRRRHEAVSGGNVSLYSQPFFTGRYGYKMCARVYLNGDGAGKGTHVSLFFVVMQGDYDDILPWPFRQKVTMVLVDQRNQRKHLTDSFKPDPSSSSFQKPTSPMNIASGCPLFVPHTTLAADDTFLKDDVLYFKIFVDTEMHP